MHEKLINDTEDKQKTISERIFLIKGKKEAVNIVNVVGKLLRKMDDKKEVVNILRSVAPGINIVR